MKRATPDDEQDEAGPDEAKRVRERSAEASIAESTSDQLEDSKPAVTPGYAASTTASPAPPPSEVDLPVSSGRKVLHEQPFRCADCGRRYKNIESYRRHERSIHSGVLYPCDWCGKPLARPDSRKRHEKTCHVKLGKLPAAGGMWWHDAEGVWKATGPPREPLTAPQIRFTSPSVAAPQTSEPSAKLESTVASVSAAAGREREDAASESTGSPGDESESDTDELESETDELESETDAERDKPTGRNKDGLAVELIGAREASPGPYKDVGRVFEIDSDYDGDEE
ncbi:hypothetical protein FA95DRAFT_1567341 [Auriscalpium vulgare]|uniref:Uncharacterized protein n=1 Tax=Auriscalpium vulgare TaxID=40419 RepID=A0ACB8R4X2_9AGAM|nr:hypothetical protein FA95DRAFT_1567341 [Auriscalpium vulgare]